MPVFLKQDRSVLFVHIPKTGGSTVERVFRASGWEMALRETVRSHPQLMAVRRCSPQHYHAALLEELFALDRFDLIFAVIREPLGRFRSEYLMRNRRDPRTDAASVEAWGERVLARREKDPYALDNHLRPQHEFVGGGAQLYRMESGLEAMFADLSARYQVDLAAAVPRAMDSAARTGVSSSQVEVSPRLEEQLRQVYAADFALLGS